MPGLTRDLIINLCLLVAVAVLDVSIKVLDLLRKLQLNCRPQIRRRLVIQGMLQLLAVHGQVKSLSVCLSAKQQPLKLLQFLLTKNN